MNEKINYNKHKTKDINELKQIAKEIRKDIVGQVYIARSGHPGGSLSIADIITVLYFNEMNIDEKNPKMEERDRFVLSKGHCAPALYAALSKRGFFEKDGLKSFRKIESFLQGHPDMKKTPGVDCSSGSLGQGLSIANGMAISAKLDNKSYRVYCLLGDGEIDEGQVWEAAMSASHYKLDNLCVIVDYNGLQIDGQTQNVMNLLSISEKFKAFGFEVFDIDGHNFDAIRDAFESARKIKNKPVAIIAKTIKGKGVSFMEDNAGWHGKAPNEEEYNQAIADIDNN